MRDEGILDQFRRMLAEHRCAASGVYIVQAGGTGAYKIGRSTNMLSRLTDLQISCPTAMTLIAVIEGNAATERRLHERFAEKRIRGEWFRLTADDLKTIVAPTTDTARRPPLDPILQSDIDAFSESVDRGWREAIATYEPEGGWAALAAEVLEVPISHPYAEYFGKIAGGPMRQPFPDGLIEWMRGDRRIGRTL
jgi:hypothetical protein